MTAPSPDTSTAFDHATFWSFYDAWLESGGYDERLNAKLSALLANRPDPCDFHRPERNWWTPWAWVALRHDRLGSELQFPVRIGEVIVIQYCWDRDVPVTQVPVAGSIVSGYIIGRQTRNLFLPLYEPVHIRDAVKRRLDRDREEIERFLAEEQPHWVQRKPR